MAAPTSCSDAVNYVVTLNCSNLDAYDIDELDCMFQQVLAIHLGLADQVEPLAMEDGTNMTYTWGEA